MVKKNEERVSVSCSSTPILHYSGSQTLRVGLRSLDFDDALECERRRIYFLTTEGATNKVDRRQKSGTWPLESPWTLVIPKTCQIVTLEK